MHRGETNDTLPYPDCIRGTLHLSFWRQHNFLVLFHFFCKTFRKNMYYCTFLVYMLFAWTHLKRCGFLWWNTFLLLNLWLKRTKTKYKHCSWNKSADTTEVRRMPWQNASQRELQVISLPIKTGPGEDFTQWSNPWGRWTNKASHWRWLCGQYTLDLTQIKREKTNQSMMLAMENSSLKEWLRKITTYFIVLCRGMLSLEALLLKSHLVRLVIFPFLLNQLPW